MACIEFSLAHSYSLYKCRKAMLKNCLLQETLAWNYHGPLRSRKPELHGEKALQAGPSLSCQESTKNLQRLRKFVFCFTTFTLAQWVIGSWSIPLSREFKLDIIYIYRVQNLFELYYFRSNCRHPKCFSNNI